MHEICMKNMRYSNVMKRIARTICVIAVLVTMAASCAEMEKLERRETAEEAVNALAETEKLVYIERVIDGDSVVMAGGMQMRYIGIDTPEMDPLEYCGREAEEYNRRLVEGKNVRVAAGREEKDRYGRLLGYVYVTDDNGEEIFVNALMLRSGLARTLNIPPNTSHAVEFARLEKDARESGRGIWGDDNCAR